MSQAQQREAPSLTRDDHTPASPACDPASMSTDGYGAQVSVREGIPSFTLVGHTDGEQQMIAELLQRSLAGLWPRRRITVVVPPDWSPNHHAIMALARAIHFEHTCGTTRPARTAASPVPATH